MKIKAIPANHASTILAYPRLIQVKAAGIAPLASVLLDPIFFSRQKGKNIEGPWLFKSLDFAGGEQIPNAEWNSLKKHSKPDTPTPNKKLT